uniref:Uncharacterized protein n=1 Tax=Avena sativa TaxID=4498 RepID=A0ACD5WIZ8_AVESA
MSTPKPHEWMATTIAAGNTGVATVVTLLVLVFLYHKMRAAMARQIREQLHRRLPPGPAGTLPVIGNLHQVLWHRPAVSRWIHGLLEEMGTDIVCLRLGPVHVIATACPEMAREVLQKKDAAFASRPATFSSGLASFGYKGAILSPHGEQWRKMRRVLTSEILAPSMERQLHHLREAVSDHLVRWVYDTARRGNGTVDVRHVAQHFCGNMVRTLAFGKRCFGAPPAASASGGPGEDEVAHVAALFTLIHNIYDFWASDYIPALVGLDLEGHEKVVKRAMRTLNRLHDPVIEDRIGCRETQREARDFLDVLVSLDDAQGEPLLSLDEIKAQTLELMFASMDSPSNVVEWALAEMMNMPDVMHKAIDELDTVVGKDRLVQEHDIPRLNYLKSCIREAFRIHPYHALHEPRVAMEDTTIAGYAIPKGSHVILSRTALGRNPKIWTEPLEFRPERHLNALEDGAVGLGEPGLRFISFSAGRRGCPGISLGTSVTMMLFARMLQGFTWTEPPGVGVGNIGLQESKIGHGLAEPLVLQARPRLAAHLYRTN